MIKSFFNNNVNILPSIVYKDKRGFFFESYNSKNFQKMLKKRVFFVQDNISYSKKGVFRGLHFQSGKYKQRKALQVLDGIILDVVVDIRYKSKTFGKFITYKLDSIKKESIFIENGFAHGFLTLSDTALIMYKVDNFYNKQKSHTLDYLDHELKLNIEKNISKKIILSNQDQNGLSLNQILKMKIK